MNVTYSPEPELEFGSSIRHIDIRFGLMNYGPLDSTKPSRAKSVRLGIVGSADSANTLHSWLVSCQAGLEAKQSYQPSLFPRFPGYGLESPFRAELVTDARTIREIPKSAIAELSRIDDDASLLEQAAALFTAEIRYLAQEAKVDVVVCALPYELLEILSHVSEAPDLDDETVDRREPPPPRRHSFRALLKARAMRFTTPLQIVLPSTYGMKPPKGKSRRRRPSRAARDPLLQRNLQDEATRAWNFFTALYYKGGGIPWRLVRNSGALSSCYVGVGFYRTLDDQHMFSSAAQVFDERGDGQIVRGAAAVLDKNDRTPHLTGEDSAAILRRALTAFYDEHEHYPARVVVHKTSYFTDDEIDGMREAARDLKIGRVELLSIRDSALRLFRNNPYPPLRGTSWEIDHARTVLYTKGGVPFFETYPGMYIPRPLDIWFDATETSSELLIREILALTKMNWNSTQFDHAYPITLEAADHTSKILKFLPHGGDGSLQPSYRFYM